MKAAVAVDGTEVAPHFGRCEAYVVADLDDGQVGPVERVESPGHEPGRLPAMLNELGVKIVVAGGMGPRAIGFFQEYGIDVIAGVTGPAEAALALLARGELEGGFSTCSH